MERRYTGLGFPVVGIDASDGTMGLKVIKAENGITFAQDLKSAHCDSMPASAIAAGCVDFVLRPREIAKELVTVADTSNRLREDSDTVENTLPNTCNISELENIFRYKKLEQELEANKIYLQSIIEEHEASNEELQSAIEEIQSTNEELNTVNDELEHRNAELSTVNNDLRNIIASANLPLIMLNEGLVIRYFSPQANQLLNIIDSDIGRPISNIRANINIGDISKHSRRVIDTLNPFSCEIVADKGNIYSMRIRPYRSEDYRITGVVIVFVDVNSASESLLTVVRDSNDAIIMQSIDGKILAWNPMASKRYEYSEQ